MVLRVAEREVAPQVPSPTPSAWTCTKAKRPPSMRGRWTPSSRRPHSFPGAAVSFRLRILPPSYSCTEGCTMCLEFSAPFSESLTGKRQYFPGERSRKPQTHRTVEHERVHERIEGGCPGR